MARHGEPNHIPNEKSRESVKFMTAWGITQPFIAKIIGISVDTLAKHYQREMELGLSEVITTIAGCLYKKAEKGDLGAQIFLLKTRGRWREQIPEGENILRIEGGLPERPKIVKKTKEILDV